MRVAVVLLLLGGCATEPKATCLDWKHYKELEEKCTPLYGQMICVTREVTKYRCVLRDTNVEDVDRSSS
jgi:hypothetical protein